MHPFPAVPRLSVVMSTYNRGDLLKNAIRSVLGQDEETVPPFELIVVDNNSTDHTREIVEGFARPDQRVRYLFERQQGLSYARNAGIGVARAPLIAFTDDDVRAAPDWVASIVRAFAEYPEADMVGGRVLPLWPSPPPRWLTIDHWSPLALVDHGPLAFEVTLQKEICLVGANVAFRREVFDLVGLFGVDFQRVKDSIGSLEDHEFELRLLRRGRKGVYDPRILVQAEIQPDRLDRDYHRRWYTGHGHFTALMLRAEHAGLARPTLAGVPPYVYKEGFVWFVKWLAALVASRKPGTVFHRELQLRSVWGFVRTRRREHLAKPRHERRREFARLVRHRFRKVVPESSTIGTGAGRQQA